MDVGYLMGEKLITQQEKIVGGENIFFGGEMFIEVEEDVTVIDKNNIEV